MASRRTKTQGFAVCLRNAGYGASLEVRKLYAGVDDPGAEANDLIRVIDESGEDYAIRPGCFEGSPCLLRFSAPFAWPPR